MSEATERKAHELVHRLRLSRAYMLMNMGRFDEAEEVIDELEAWDNDFPEYEEER